MVGREQRYIPDQHHVVLKDVEVIIHSRAGPRAEKWTIVKSERGLGWESPDVVGVLERQSKAKFCNVIGSFGSDDLDETIRPLMNDTKKVPLCQHSTKEVPRLHSYIAKGGT